jgi:phage gp36-like protein
MSYSPIISADDIYGSIYEELVTEITRDESAITDKAISKAIEEAKMYLGRYDRISLFGEAGDIDTAATFTSDLLKSLCVDIAIWQLVKLGNPNIKFETAKEGYQMALATLKNIQKGLANPNWPYLETTGESAPKGNSVQSSSFEKRRNNF